ncbi:AbrB/MazE/SpoVT family DNA-binding domain-containing protein [Ornithinibacillus contaminans]|uniref:AbrB/MazE/SpoVT family DNA-binding domain-containing protein n=1 Tax=Ornithinibacillus contaminans TaxID=694055 RepID=UPI0012ED2615|nr:AbrB/MazE/SpoVT family DNA-binding domain-containing protein [Ornithinibacillus contaminans]
MVNRNEGEIFVTTKVQKWGNSLAVRIPKVVTDNTKIVEGSDINITVENQTIKITPVKKKPTLEELMAQITPENQHDVVDWGKPVGRELW